MTTSEKVHETAVAIDVTPTMAVAIVSALTSVAALHGITDRKYASRGAETAGIAIDAIPADVWNNTMIALAELGAKSAITDGAMPRQIAGPPIAAIKSGMVS